MDMSVVKFWMRELFCDLKVLPCVSFLHYVMGSKGDHYRPVVRERKVKEKQWQFGVSPGMYPI